MRYIKTVVILLFFGSLLQSCYSFSGSSLTIEKTFQVKEFPNNAPLVNPMLSQQFSTDLQNRFAQRTTLKGSKENPDILIEGEITDYYFAPTTISSTTTTSTMGTIQDAQTRLVIAVKVIYENRTPENKEKSFTRIYTDEAVFNSSLSQSEIENSQVKIATERIINKIFNDIAVNW